MESAIQNDVGYVIGLDAPLKGKETKMKIDKSTLVEAMYEIGRDTNKALLSIKPSHPNPEGWLVGYRDCNTIVYKALKRLIARAE